MRLAKSEVIGMSLVRDISSHNAVVDLPSPHYDCPSLLDALEVYIDQKVLSDKLDGFAVDPYFW